MKTINDVERQAEQSVELSRVLKEIGPLKDGYRMSIHLRGKSRDKRGDAAFEKNWSCDSDEVRIRFKPAKADLQPEVQPNAQATAGISQNREAQTTHVISGPSSDLIRALDRAESRHGYSFVALKWFRDTALPAEGFAWASADSARQAVLRETIEKRLILTSKVPNPKSPQFPVTAIRLNRLMPEVRAILGGRDERVSDFQPVSIRGENLSVTVLRDRR